MAKTPLQNLEAALKYLAGLEKKKKPKAPKKAKRPKQPKPKRWHHAPTTGERHPSSAGDPWKSAHGVSGGEMPAIELVADRAIGGVLLELAGEGKIGLATALAAWQRDQERITNRVWRRPGGLQRMGGL
jgi:hypothetical protein